MEPDAAAVPSLSSLLFLAADQVASPWLASYALTRYPVPCKDAYVERLALATVLVGAAFWGLRSQGLVDLRVAEVELWPTSRSTPTEARVMVTRLGGGTRAGLEGALLAAVGQRCSAYEAGCRLLGVHKLLAIVGWPSSLFQLGRRGPSVVFDQVTGELASLGFYELQPAPRPFPRWRRPRRAPVCERIAGLRPACDEAAARWRSFQETESELSQRLYRACADAIAQAPGGLDPASFGV